MSGAVPVNWEEEWTDMHERIKEVSKDTGVEIVGQRIAGLGEGGVAKDGDAAVLLGEEGFGIRFQQKVRSSESLLAIWNVRINKALRV